MAYDFTRWTHRARWRIGYYLRPWSLPIACVWRGHDQVHEVDYHDGFDMIWCRRCMRLLRG